MFAAGMIGGHLHTFCQASEQLAKGVEHNTTCNDGFNLGTSY